MPEKTLSFHTEQIIEGLSLHGASLQRLREVAIVFKYRIFNNRSQGLQRKREAAYSK